MSKSREAEGMRNFTRLAAEARKRYVPANRFANKIANVGNSGKLANKGNAPFSRNKFDPRFFPPRSSSLESLAVARASFAGADRVARSHIVGRPTSNNCTRTKSSFKARVLLYIYRVAEESYTSAALTGTKGVVTALQIGGCRIEPRQRPSENGVTA